MISRERGGGEKKKRGRKRERGPGGSLVDRESGKKTLLPSASLSLSLSLLSLERRDPTRAGLNWAGHVDGEQGRDRGILPGYRDGLGTGQRVPG